MQDHLPTLYGTVHWAAGVVILAEALNKLDRYDFAWRGCTWWARAALLLKLPAWILLAVAAGGAVGGPLFSATHPELREVAIFAGFAILIIRTRVKDELA